jgi:hypothetical protein
MKREPFLVNSAAAVSERQIAVRTELASWQLINTLHKNLFE